MRLDPNTAIAGQPIKHVRQLLRRIDNGHWGLREIADFFHIDAAQAEALIAELAERGFLQQSELRRCEGERLYECGPLGPRVASARLSKPISRAKADAIVAAFLERVKMINARPELLERVCEVRVFGSYLEARADVVGDVDLAVNTERKSGRHWVHESLRRADESGRTFANYLDRVAYGHTEVMRLLKMRNRYLSLHTIADLEEIGAPFKVIFKNSSGLR